MTRRFPLATRLTIYLLAVLVVLHLVALFFYERDIEDRRRERVETATRSAQNVAATLGAFVSDIESTAAAVTEALAYQERPIDQASNGPILAAIAAQEPALRSIFITDRAGRVIASSATGVGVDLSARPYIQALARGAPQVWSGSLTGLQSGEITVAYGRRVAPGDAPRAFVVFAFHPERLLTTLELVTASDASLTITDQSGLVLYDSRRAEIPAAERDLRGLSQVQRALRGEVVQVIDEPVPFGDERRYGAFVPVKRVGWVLGYLQPQAPLDAELRERAVTNALAVTIVLLVAAAVMIAVANRLTRPLARLARTAGRIARGERPEVLEERSGGVEVRELSAAMRAMGDAVARREEHLRLLADASLILGSTLDPRRSLDELARAAVPRFADWCVIDVVTTSTAERLHLVRPDPVPPDVAAALASPPERDPASAYARVMRRAEPILIEELREEHLAAAAEGDARRAEAYRAMRPLSAIVVPVNVRGSLAGAITFLTADRSGRRYTSEDLGVALDVARRVAGAIDNARLYEDVQLALRTRDEFLSSAAHELKTPLTSIKGFSQLARRTLARESLDREALAHVLQRIDEATSKMTTSVDDLLEVARLQLDPLLRLERAPTDLVALVREVVAQQEATTDRHRIRLDAPDRVVGAWDRARMERAITNLVANAVKYSPDGGDIDVRVEDRGAEAYVEVTDRGVGIPAEDLPRIFERFRRGGNVVGRIGGTGIGLTLVRQIVEQHGGSVTVRSERGAGSTFAVTLPKEAEPAASAAAG